jgi:hypothetical protein
MFSTFTPVLCFVPLIAATAASINVVDVVDAVDAVDITAFNVTLTGSIPVHVHPTIELSNLPIVSCVRSANRCCAPVVSVIVIAASD